MFLENVFAIDSYSYVHPMQILGYWEAHRQSKAKNETVMV